MADRIFYTIAAVIFAAAIWIVISKRLKEHQPPADNVYQLHRRIL